MKVMTLQEKEEFYGSAVISYGSDNYDGAAGWLGPEGQFVCNYRYYGGHTGTAGVILHKLFDFELEDLAGIGWPDDEDILMDMGWARVDFITVLPEKVTPEQVAMLKFIQKKCEVKIKFYHPLKRRVELWIEDLDETLELQEKDYGIFVWK